MKQVSIIVELVSNRKTLINEVEALAMTISTLCFKNILSVRITIGTKVLVATPVMRPNTIDIPIKYFILVIVKVFQLKAIKFLGWQEPKTGLYKC